MLNKVSYSLLYITPRLRFGFRPGTSFLYSLRRRRIATLEVPERLGPGGRVRISAERGAFLSNSVGASVEDPGGGRNTVGAALR